LPPLALAAALLFAAALALGFLTGWTGPLGAALFRYDPALLNTAQAGIQRYVSPDLWDVAVLPLLERPSWVVPAALGVVLLLAQASLLLLRRRRRSGASI
jgi:hypothetical protein